MAKTISGKKLFISKNSLAIMNSKLKVNEDDNGLCTFFDDDDSNELWIKSSKITLPIFKGEEDDPTNQWCAILAELRQPG